MQYLLYLIAFILFLFGLITFIKPLKANRIINVLVYMIPFWMWGLILIALSVFSWQFKETFLSLLFLIKGLFLIFSPKRNIKKGIENWKKLPSEIKKIESVIYIIISFLIITTIL